MSLAADFTFDNDNRIISQTSGSTVYTVNELYSYIQDLFDDIVNLTTPVPMSAQTPTEYSLINGWFIPENTFKYLKGGAIKTEGWDGEIYIVKFSTYTNCVPSDIGTIVTDGTRTGILLDYNNTLKKWWIRKVSGTAWSGTISGPGTGTGTVTSVVTGETLYANIYTLGLLEPTTTNTLYVQQVNSELTNNQIAQYWPAGHIDLLVRVKEADTLIDSGTLRIFCREYTDLYSHFTVNASSGGRNPIPLGTADDSNNQTASGTVATWTDVVVSFGSYSVDLGNGNGARTYEVEVDCGSRTNIQQVYERLKYITSRGTGLSLNGALGQFYRSSDDAYVESVTSPFGTFAGGKFFGARGVYFKNVPVNDLTNVTFIDSSGATQTYPFVATGEILVSDALKNDSNAVYRVFFNSVPDGNYGTINAVMVRDSNDQLMSGLIANRSSIPWTFDYDSNTQGNRTAGTDATVKVVGLGLTTGQLTVSTYTITRSTNQLITLTAATENNYA